MLELVTLRARPDLLEQVFSGAIQGGWPEFMQHDPAAQLYFGKPHLEGYRDTAEPPPRGCALTSRAAGRWDRAFRCR